MFYLSTHVESDGPHSTWLVAAVQDGTGLKAGQRDTRGAGEHPRGPPAQPEGAQERDLFQDICIPCQLL